MLLLGITGARDPGSNTLKIRVTMPGLSLTPPPPLSPPPTPRTRVLLDMRNSVQIHEEMVRIDYDRSGTIEFKEFVILMKKVRHVD